MEGEKKVNGGYCLVPWDLGESKWPIDFGGLGILNLNITGWTLHMRWLWLRKTSATRPWMGLDIPIQPHVRSIFAILVISLVGNGEKDSVFVWSLATWPDLGGSCSDGGRSGSIIHRSGSTFMETWGKRLLFFQNGLQPFFYGSITMVASLEILGPI